MKRSLLILSAVLFAFTASSAFGFYVSNCPQVCTPSCPCSLQCQGPLGPTTCGQAGQACTNFASNPETESNTVLVDSFEELLNSLETTDLMVELEAQVEQDVKVTEETPVEDSQK